MNFINHTPFPSQTFEAQDQHLQSFHVVVLRATLDITPDGTLVLSPEQRPLVLTDEFHGEMNRSSVRQESDLAPFKPLCDVIINATAYAPGGRRAPRFTAGVRISGAAKGKNSQGMLIRHKQLSISGPRCWKKGVLGWNLTESEPITSLPVRYEYAYGGENRVEADDPVARKVPAKHRLTQEQAQQHPDGPDAAPIAHAACESNPLGCGFVEPWYLDAAHSDLIQAPQIEALDGPVREFERAHAPQGLGSIARSWQPRLKAAGTYDDAWFRDQRPFLPHDFDFAYWNCAHPDLQLPYLKGDEQFELSNLTPHGELIFRLPGLSLSLLADTGRREKEPLQLHLDTVIIEPDSMMVNLVWRAFFPASPELLSCEVKLFFKEDCDDG